MHDSNSDRDPIDLLADSFVGRLRAGQRPSISEYAKRYPELAGEVRDLLPALVELEQNATADSLAGDLSARGAEAKPHQLGEYTIVREIGRGGMGVVYEAVQESLGRHVALKVLPVGGEGSARLERFRREAKAAARLHHSNIVPVYGIAEHQGAHYYAMQFIQGHSLNLVIDELRRLRKEAARSSSRRSTSPSARELASDSNQPIGPQIGDSTVGDRYASDTPVSSEFTTPASAHQFYRSVAKVGLQVADALAYAHSQGIMHRDIKPSNLLLDGSGTVWVTDFGLAKSDGVDDLTESGDVVGTLQYMAPERLDGRSDPRSDVYALGATLYELVALEPLYAARGRARLIERILYEEPLPLGKRDPGIPRDLETIIEKSLLKEASERYASAEQIADDLRLFLADRTIRARRTTAAERFWRWRRRNPALAAVTFALLLVFALGFAGVAWKWREAEQARNDEQIARKQADRRADEIEQGHAQLLEAGRLMDLGAQFAERGQFDDAAIVLTLAIETRPDLTSAWEKRGELYFRLGLYDLAAVDYQHAFALREPILHWQWLRLALLRLHMGDTAGQRQVSDRMTKRFFGTGDPSEVVSLVRTRLLTSVAEPEARRWLAVAKRAKAAQQVAVPDHVLGIAHYRSGQFEQAVQCCENEITGPQAHGIAQVILAMAYERVGQFDQARSNFASAMQKREQHIANYHAPSIQHWAMHQGAVADGTGWPDGLLDWLEFEWYFREAASMLDLPLPSDDFQSHVLRGRAFAGLRERERADEEYCRALELKDDKHIRYERNRNRGFQLVALDRFSEAADSFAQALAHSPDDCHLWTFLATAQFMAGDATSYRRTCHSMFERFKNDTDGSHLFNVAWTCTLLPDALPDMQALAPVAQTAAGWWIDSERVLVATHYRVGRYEDALSSLDRLTQVIRPEPAALFFGAMAHQRLGQQEEAQQKLREGIAAMATTATRYATRVHLLDFDPRAWTDKVTDRLLRREAEALILTADDRDAVLDKPGK